MHVSTDQLGWLSNFCVSHILDSLHFQSSKFSRNPCTEADLQKKVLAFFAAQGTKGIASALAARLQFYSAVVVRRLAVPDTSAVRVLHSLSTVAMCNLQEFTCVSMRDRTAFIWLRCIPVVRSGDRDDERIVSSAKADVVDGVKLEADPVVSLAPMPSEADANATLGNFRAVQQASEWASVAFRYFWAPH